MKKVLNWTVGSFFRTIGRTIAFLVMGGLIYYLLSYNGIGLKDLFFERVDALSFDGEYSGQQSVFSSQKDFSGLAGNNFQQTLHFNTIIDGTNRVGQYAVFIVTGTISSYDSYNDSPSQYDPNKTIGELFKVNNIYYKVQMYSASGGAWQMCTIQENAIVCPIAYSTYGGLVFEISTDQAIYFDLHIHPYVSFYKKDTNTIIDSQNQNTQDIINNQNQNHEELMDSNTTEAEEEASSFFEDFDAPDIGGLSAIVTAPLTTIQSLLNSTCTNLQLPLPYVNKTLTLPCMNSIYTEHFGAFFSIYQTIMLAIIAYRCIRSIFFDIHGFTNPSDDRIEVMDL